MNMQRWLLTCVPLWLLLLAFCGRIVAGDDYYSLLGVEKDADDRTIRRAFKKLAMSKHPDKNQDNPSAHDEFVKLNRAYEVLKDPDLRKKYDLYGDAGLKEENQQYQSWQFYRDNFGIYDDDADISTLSRMEFEAEVLGKAEPWFINFYSTRCSHCHQLAPAVGDCTLYVFSNWRKLAAKLRNVVRIGAVNCDDEWMLCRQEMINGFPSLIFFPDRTYYNGDRSEESLIDFVMQRVKHNVFELNVNNMEYLVKESKLASRPWLLSFCDAHSSSCVDSLNIQILSAMFDSLLNVADVKCLGVDGDLCDQLQVHSGLVYFPAGKIDAENAHAIDEFDSAEVAKHILRLLPDIETIDESGFQQLVDNEEEPAVLLHFVDGDGESDPELRRLPSLTKGVPIRRIDCQQSGSLCGRLGINKRPAFAVHKNGIGLEVHYGRASPVDVASFAQDAAQSAVRLMNAEQYARCKQQNAAACVVDFFAPWCPPCMKLIPELRKASQQLHKNAVVVGLIDCTVNLQLCQQAGVNQYPTLILYNQSASHSFLGLHSANEILEFVDDIQNPTVITLTDDNFNELVVDRPAEQLWVVDFFAPWCGHCQQLAPEWRKLAKSLRPHSAVRIATVDCTASPNVCMRQRIQSYPTIRLFPSAHGPAQDYNHWQRNAAVLRQWVASQLPSRVPHLTEDDFYHKVLLSKQPYIVDYYAPWCGHCVTFAPTYELVAEQLSGSVECAKVNCDELPNVCQMAGVRSYPTLRLYTGAVAGQEQHAWGHPINSQHLEDIVLTVSDLLKQHQPADVKDEL